MNRDKMFKQVCDFLERVTGEDLENCEEEAELIDLGIDSVMLMTISGEMNKEFGVNLSISDIMIQYDTIGKLVSYMMEHSNVSEEAEEVKIEKKEKEEPVIEYKEERVSEETSTVTIPSNISAQAGNDISSIIMQQRETMERVFVKQLEVLSMLTANKGTVKELPKVKKEEKVERPIVKKEEKRSSNGKKKDALTEKQRKMLQELIESLSKKNKESKHLADKYRECLSDLDEIAGFTLLLKELHYIISAEYGKKGHFVDVDGNDYIDIAMGFGSLLLGHTPDEEIAAIKQEVEKGFQLGTRHRLVGEVAKLICELTGYDRAVFTVTGTEAVMTAFKFARTYTRKDKIGIFTGCYHGHNDATLATKFSEDGELVPIAPGISKGAISDTIMFEYNDVRTLDKIRKHAHELAAVIVEPVQSRRPGIQPVEFLKELRKVTEEEGILLIFDEIITGFRCNVGGAKKLFGIEPDLSTYGKAVCNGMPMGVLAGKREIMDVGDGGQWKYGDDSYPKVTQTYYAGTFFKHPFSVAAAHSVLTFFKKDQNKLQESLTKKTEYLVERINAIMKENNVPIEVNNFSSLYRFKELNDNSYINIFYYKLLDYGVYTWEGRTCFMSAQHTDEDIEGIIQAVEHAISDMVDAGFYPGSTAQVEEKFQEGLIDYMFYE